MYCKICHKSKPDNHFDLYPDHAVARKRPLYMGEEDDQDEASPPTRTPRAPRVPAGAAPYDTSEGGGGGFGVLALGIMGVGAVGYGVYKWWKNRGGGATPGEDTPGQAPI